MKFQDGKTKQCFLEAANWDMLKRRMEGEFHAISALHNIDGIVAPKPNEWGVRS